MQSFKSGDEIIHFRDEGPRSEIAFVFVNSLGTDLRVWDNVIKELDQKYPTVRVDKRGHGLSTNFENNISISPDVSALRLYDPQISRVTSLLNFASSFLRNLSI